MHDDVETFSALLAFCEGNPPVTGGFPSQRPVTRSFLWRSPEQIFQQTVEMSVIWDAMALIVSS